MSCGACCAYFHVAFYWREAAPETPCGVPRELVEEVDDFQRCMKGTSANRKLRCVALQGTIGKKVWCTIYQRRPSPCRDFEASYEGGDVNIRCAKARAAHGLPPLRSRDYPIAAHEDMPACPL
jgi:Fe-S-cluster containining protein